MKSLPEIRDWISFCLAVGLPVIAFITRRRGQRVQGVRHVLHLHDTVTATDAVVVRPAMLNLSPVHGTSQMSLDLTTPTQIRTF